MKKNKSKQEKKNIRYTLELCCEHIKYVESAAEYLGNGEMKPNRAEIWGKIIDATENWRVDDTLLGRRKFERILEEGELHNEVIKTVEHDDSRDEV